MLVLIHRRMNGEPVGAWNDAGESVYQPGFEHLQDDGYDTISVKGSAVPWSVFVDKVSNSVNFQEWWTAMEAPDVEQALLSARDSFFTTQDAAIPRDR